MPPAGSPTVLLTRPAPDSRRFAAVLGDLPVVISPILKIVVVAHDAAALQAAPGLVFTSAHAVPAAGAGQGRIAYCVGGHTAAAARAAGFEIIEGPGDAAGLAPMLAQSTVPLIHVRGRHVTRDLGVPGMVVYDQQPQGLSDAALALLAGQVPVILPLFSPRSARLLARAAAGAVAPLWLAPISEATRTAWDGPAAACRIAEAPDADSVKRAIMTLLSGEQC